MDIHAIKLQLTRLRSIKSYCDKCSCEMCENGDCIYSDKGSCVIASVTNGSFPFDWNLEKIEKRYINNG